METPETILASVGALSYGGIFISALLANIVIPVPEEIVLLALGYLAGGQEFSFPIIYGLVILGLLTSDCVLYFFARRGNKYLKKMLDSVRQNKLLGDDNFVQKHIGKIIIGARFIVQFRFIGPVLSGVIQLPFRTFLAYNTLGIMIYSGIVLGIGSYFRDRIQALLSGVGVVRNIIFAILALLILMFIFKKVKKAFFGKFFASLSEDYIPTWFPGIFKRKK